MNGPVSYIIGILNNELTSTEYDIVFLFLYFYSSMSNSLTMLDLSGNFLDEIPFAAFKTLKLVEWLNLSK